MKKERNRFDAVAEELLDPKPEKLEAIAQPSTNTALGTVTRYEPLRQRTLNRPNAYISVNGEAHLVIDWQMRSSMDYDPRNADFFGIEFAMPTHMVELKLSGRVLNLMQSSMDADVVLVVLRGDIEPLYYRLIVRDVTWTRNARDEYTTVEANAMQVTKVKKKVKRFDLPALERAARIRKMLGFKVIIAGSRHLDTDRVKQIIRAHWKAACEHWGQRPDYILSGACPTGADRAGEKLAKKLTGRRAIRFPANWDLLGRNAGIHRNLDMACCAHGLFLVWDGKSRGSSHMLSCMEVRGRLIYEIEVG